MFLFFFFLGGLFFETTSGDFLFVAVPVPHVRSMAATHCGEISARSSCVLLGSAWFAFETGGVGVGVCSVFAEAQAVGVTRCDFLAVFFCTQGWGVALEGGVELARSRESSAFGRVGDCGCAGSGGEAVHARGTTAGCLSVSLAGAAAGCLSVSLAGVLLGFGARCLAAKNGERAKLVLGSTLTMVFKRAERNWELHCVSGWSPGCTLKRMASQRTPFAATPAHQHQAR